MKITLRFLTAILCLITACPAIAQKQPVTNAIYSGVAWFDNRGEVLSAHAAGMIRDKGRFYVFGEKHLDNSNAFAGFTCYSSADLYNWKFESIALPLQDTGRLGPNRVGERPKVLKCPKTSEYVMLMHTDDMGYKDEYTGYATAKTVAGPYTFKGALLFNGKPIRRWDMGSFQDSDGSGYLLTHSGDIYKLSDDYHSVTRQVAKNLAPECESPAVFKKGGLYYWLGSYRTSWERNDNFYYTATSLAGPWVNRGSFAPKGTSTWNSQTTFVLSIAGTTDTTYLFMGDRWSYPLQASAATYVWQPLTVAGTSLSIPQFNEGWQINTVTGKASAIAVNWKVIDKKLFAYSGKWAHSALADSSDDKGATLTVKFSGKQIGLYSMMGTSGGYAKVTLKNSQGKTVLSATVDMYCNHPVKALTFLSPVLAKDNYTLTVTVMGEHSSWADKKRSDYGSKGDLVSVERLVTE